MLYPSRSMPKHRAARCCQRHQSRQGQRRFVFPPREGALAHESGQLRPSVAQSSHALLLATAPSFCIELK